MPKGVGYSSYGKGMSKKKSPKKSKYSYGSMKGKSSMGRYGHTAKYSK